MLNLVRCVKYASHGVYAQTGWHTQTKLVPCLHYATSYWRYPCRQECFAEIGIPRRPLYQRVCFTASHGLSSPTSQLCRNSMCRSEQQQVHVLYCTSQRFILDSSATRYPRCSSHTRLLHVYIVAQIDTLCDITCIIPIIKNNAK